MEPRIRHVFWDATNTLLRVRGSVGRIYAEAARRHGLAADPEAIDQRFPGVVASIPQPLQPDMPPLELRRVEEDWWRRVARSVLAPFGPFPQFEAFFDEVFETFRHRDAWELVPGARAALAGLRQQDRRLGIISDMDSRLFEVLDAFGLAETFDVVCLSFPCGYQKPDRRLFEWALTHSGAAAAASAHLGDSPGSDVRGALAAGMIAIHFDPERRGETPEGGHALHDLARLPDLLALLESRM